MAEKAKSPDEIKDKSGKNVSGDNDKLLAAISAIPLIGLIIYLAMPDSSAFVKNYARQGAFLLIVSIGLSVLSIIPFVNLLACIVWIVMIVFMVMLLVNALQENKEYQLPLIGDWAKQLFK